MLDIGLIGLGSDWESRCRPALLRLRGRLRVRGVYTAVANRAEPVAAEFQCRAAHSLRELLHRPDLKAVLVLDSAWLADLPARLACEVGRPAFYLGGPAVSAGNAVLLADCSSQSRVTLMPGLRLRYIPATIRLRELLATQLGRPLEITLTLRAAGPEELSTEPAIGPITGRLVEILDWCQFIAATEPRQITVSEEPRDGTFGMPEEAGRELRILYRQPARGGPAATATIVASANVWSAPSDPVQCVTMRVRGTSGLAEILSTHKVQWQIGDTLTIESLEGERCDLELMLDQFSRRIVGGLVPVPTFDDLTAAWAICQQAAMPNPK